MNKSKYLILPSLPGIRLSDGIDKCAADDKTIHICRNSPGIFMRFDTETDHFWITGYILLDPVNKPLYRLGHFLSLAGAGYPGYGHTIYKTL